MRNPLLPYISDELASWLKENYPAICWDPSRQTEWQHHRYSGMYSLAEHLIGMNEQQNRTDGLEPDAVRAT